MTSEAAAYARLHPVPDIFALGDCCANPHAPLPALAQVAEQQGRYLAHVLNEEARDGGYQATEFVYKHMVRLFLRGLSGRARAALRRWCCLRRERC